MTARFSALQKKKIKKNHVFHFRPLDSVGVPPCLQDSGEFKGAAIVPSPPLDGYDGKKPGTNMEK